MPVLRFPNPQHTNADGVVAFGGDLHPRSLRLAYRQGIFPWPHDGYPLLWFCPPRRAVLPFDNLHIPRSLRRARRKLAFTCTFDTAFRAVVEGCRSVPRPGQDGTWITSEVLEGYCALHQLGDAHSAEAWDEDGELIGGVYGVDAGGVFAGESMFYTRPYASKIALLHLVEHLEERGCSFLDIQMLTPHMEAMGAREIPRALFLSRLKEEQAKGRKLF